MNARERAVVRAINRQRAHHGLAARARPAPRSPAPPTTTRGRCWTRTTSRTRRATAGRSTHRVRRFARRRALGETLAMLGGGCGRGMATRVVRMWMNSPGHRAILLSASLPAGRHRRPGRLARQRPRLRGHGGLRLTSLSHTRRAMRRVLAHPLAPVVGAALAALAYVAVQPATADMAAHAFRAWLFDTEGMTVWNAQWYGGHHVLGYSMLFAPLAAWPGPAWVGSARRPSQPPRRSRRSPGRRRLRWRRRPLPPGCSRPACSATS